MNRPVYELTSYELRLRLDYMYMYWLHKSRLLSQLCGRVAPANSQADIFCPRLVACSLISRDLTHYWCFGLPPATCWESEVCLAVVIVR